MSFENLRSHKAKATSTGGLILRNNCSPHDIVTLIAEDVIGSFPVAYFPNGAPPFLFTIVIAFLPRSLVIAFGLYFRFALSFRDVEEC